MQNKGYPQEFIDRVRDANNIVDIAKSYLPLKQKGQEFWACCPFHTEKTPSFSISNQRQFYYCYGCHTSGNVFTLVMKMENLSWPEAVAYLAKKANIPLPQLSENDAWVKARAQREKIYHALGLARDYYCANLYLPKNKAALDYLHQRGIDDELIKLFRIGYSDSWGGVIDALRRQGISEQVMRLAGIVGASEQGRIWDAQYERVTFSIHDVYGNCIGFTGRTMKNDDNLAKYKNTAESPVFNKGNIVYGIDVMKEKTRGKRIPGLIVVEGNVDEIAMVKHGFVNTVACMGTALTKFHAGIFARFGGTVYLCLDGDAAGERAALKSIATLQEAGLLVRVVTLPNQQDPDEFLRANGAPALQKLLDESMGGIEYKLWYLKKNSDLSNKIGKADYLNKVVEVLITIESAAERDLYLPEIAETVGISIEALRNTINPRLVKKTAKKEENTISSGNYVNNNHNILKNTKKTQTAQSKAEQFITAAILHGKPYAVVDLAELPELPTPLYQKVVRQGLKLCEIDDKLSAEEQEVIRPLCGWQFAASEQVQRAEWCDSLNILRRQRLETQKKQALAAGDLAAYQRYSQAIKQLKEKKVTEEN